MAENEVKEKDEKYRRGKEEKRGGNESHIGKLTCDRHVSLTSIVCKEDRWQR